MADLRERDMLEFVVLRSPHAHARILSLDTTKALEIEGVEGVFTAQDIGPLRRGSPASSYPNVPPEVQQLVPPGAKTFRSPVLALEEVTRVGEPVAVVVARDRYVAEDALEQIVAEYEPLPAVIDPTEALLPGAPIVCPEVGTNLHCRFSVTVGDVNKAFAEADYRISARIRSQREIASALETRGVIAVFEPHHRQLLVRSKSQGPHGLRRYLSEMLQMAEGDIRVIAPDVGGSFGGGIYAEEVLAAFLATRFGKPVRWIEDRAENLTNNKHSRDQVHQAEIAFNRDGKIVGLRDHLLLDGGCWPAERALTLAHNTISHMRGQYKIDNYDVEATCVFTNKLSITPVRGAGRSEAALVMDRLVEMVATRLGIDSAEVRRRNLIPGEAMPYDMGMNYRDGTRLIYDSGDFPAQFEQAMQLLNYEGLRKEQRRLRQEGRRLGIGISSGIEGTGHGEFEGAIVQVDPTGKVLVSAGSASQGQSHETVWAQVCADTLSVPFDQVTARVGDTGMIPYGGGTGASRSAVLAGSAVYGASRKLREKLIEVAAGIFEVSADEVELIDGVLRPKGVPGRNLTLKDLARATAPGLTSRSPSEAGAGLKAEHYFLGPVVTYGSSTHAAVVEVDEETGYVKLLRYVIVHECGRELNPMVVAGQMQGGVTHGLGGAMFEEAVYDSQGQFLTSSFMDYLLPAAGEVPPIDVAHQECSLTDRNPLGVKGCGEGGTTSAPAAVANAIVDAMAPLEIDTSELPLSPDRVWRLISEAKRQQAAVSA